MKKVIIVGSLILLIILYQYQKSYSDWSALNDLIEDECKVNNKYKQECWVNLHKLPWKWDKVYHFTNNSEGYLRDLLEDQSYEIGDGYCQVLVFMKDKNIQKILTQCFEGGYDWEFDYPSNWNDNLVIEFNSQKKNKGNGIFFFKFDEEYTRELPLHIPKYRGSFDFDSTILRFYDSSI